MQRLTIVEVIAHCKRRMDRAETFFSKERLEEMPLEGSAAKEYWEHRQVKEWLEELIRHRNEKCSWRYLKCPCKPGSVVYTLEYQDEKPFVDKKKVHQIEIDEDGDTTIWLKDICGHYESVQPDDFGQCVFLTIEGAEEALRGEDHGAE